MNTQSLNAMSKEELLALVAQLAKANERRVTCKVTAKRKDEKTGEMKGTAGAVSVYGLGRFPITLYATQWEKLAASMKDIMAFVDANRALLSTKPDVV